ncbi:hypothetical protein VoSk93_30320 [Vibrio owensii]
MDINTTIRTTIFTLSFITTSFALFLKHSLTEERMMLCALGNDIPVFNSEDCLFYFETFGVSQDLLSLVEYQYGISSILSGDSHSRFRMANTLIAHGFDVNWLNESNSPPLHSAIIHDDFEAFKWLMQQGANKDLYCPKVGKNATEFLDWIYTENPTANRGAMYALLH